MLCCRWLWDTLYTVHSCAICTHKARAAIRVASFTNTWQRVNSSSRLLMGMSCSPDHSITIASVFRSLDKDGSGDIDIGELLPVVFPLVCAARARPPRAQCTHMAMVPPPSRQRNGS